jgi:hypothetical protein
MKFFSCRTLFLAGFVTVSLLAPARGMDTILGRLMKKVHEGMKPEQVEVYVGLPMSVKNESRGTFTFYYYDVSAQKTWSVSFEDNRVDSIDREDGPPPAAAQLVHP